MADTPYNPHHAPGYDTHVIPVSREAEKRSRELRKKIKPLAVATDGRLVE